MNKDSFSRFVENTRDCDPVKLDSAVNKGLREAKNSVVDSGKLLALAAACAFTLALCFTVQLKPFESAVEKYHRDRNVMIPGGAEALDGYAKDIAVNFKVYIGGE
jgi:hypothetical protein